MRLYRKGVLYLYYIIYMGIFTCTIAPTYIYLHTRTRTDRLTTLTNDIKGGEMMSRYDRDSLDELMDDFDDQGLRHSPIALPIDTYTRLREAGFSEQEALELTRLICTNYYKEVELYRR